MTQAVDIVVIGAGTAGVPCAVQAAADGASVLLLERSDRIGGTLAVSGADLSGAGSRRQWERGVLGDTPQAHFEDVVRITGDTARHDLLFQSVELAAATIDWLEEEGLDFTERSPFIMMGHETYSMARTCKPLHGGPGIVAVFEKLVARERRRGNLRVEQEAIATRLLHEDGAVTGVAYEQEGRLHEVEARQMVLACGGYVGNHDMFRRRHGRPLTSVGMPTSMGDAITLTSDLAVPVVGDEHYLPTVGALLGRENVDWTEWAFPRPLLNSSIRSPWEIHVDRRGRRFSSEDHPSLTERQKAVHRLEDLTFFVVFDERALRESPPIVREWGAQGLRERAGTQAGLFVASSLEELARTAGIDPAGLARTIGEYNEAVAAGVDRHFRRRFLPAPVAEAPFYALEIHGIALDTFAGIDVDRDLRVVTEEGRPVPGLHAVGEALGAAAMTGSVICSGMLVTPCISLGRNLGKRLAAQCRFSATPDPRGARPCR